MVWAIENVPLPPDGGCIFGEIGNLERHLDDKNTYCLTNTLYFEFGF